MNMKRKAKLIIGSLFTLSIGLSSCQHSATSSSQTMDQFIDDLMSKMTVEEKIGQLNLPVTGEITTGEATNSDVAKKLNKDWLADCLTLRV